jgi:FtsP/CotA-like multicopper oxidase with cupredoxin domain
LSSFDRRHFLRGSVALGGTLLTGAAPAYHSAEAAPVRIEAPVVDRVVVQEITDGAHDIFLRGAELPGLSVQRVGPAAFAGQGKTLSSEWGSRCTSNRTRAARPEIICWISASPRLCTSTIWTC